MKSFDEYIEKVIQEIGCGKKIAAQIREDLYHTLLARQEETGISDPQELMGSVHTIAEEFRENLEIAEGSPSYYGIGGYRFSYEYKSYIKVFGLPLLHINFKRWGVAKGIIAIGNISIGIIALGGLSVGVLSLGGIALGVLSLGGVALALVAALGGIAVSWVLSVGGVAISYLCSLGGLAIAKLAIGGVARGVVAVYQQQGVGQYLFERPLDNPDVVIAAIKQALPQIGDSLLHIIQKLVRYI